MKATIGLELGPDLIRAVRIEGSARSRVRTFEQYWDPAHPAEAVAALRESLGKAGRIALTVDLSFLFAKQVRLPAVSAPEKRRILSLEPERFFPVRGEEMVLAVRGEDNLVFAVRSSIVGPWLEALEAIAPVELVEPSPVSLARALGRTESGVSTILTEEKDDGLGVAEVAAGRVRRIRRIRSDAAELSGAMTPVGDEGRVYLRPLNGNREWLAKSGIELEGQELPSVSGVPPSHLAAYGAALGLGGSLEEALLPAALSQRITARRRRSRLMAGLAAAAALVFAVGSLDQFRSRTLRNLDAEMVQVRRRAEGAVTVQRQTDELRREARAVAALDSGQVDYRAALAALTRRLPAGAHLRSLRSSGLDWQIDGYAREAAPLVAQLEEDARFKDVHFLSATSRVPLDGKTYESFSIAFRLVPSP